MKFICSLLLLTCLTTTGATAQQNHFLFIQTETRQPFNVTLNKKVFSSSASGYLIIPKLSNGQYTFSVGFGGSAIPDQAFSCVIDRKDVGFNLKDFGAQGWGLFDLQTFSVTMAGSNNATSSVAVNVEKPSPAKAENKKPQDQPAANTFQPEVEPVNKPGAKQEEVKQEQIKQEETKPVDSVAADVNTPAEKVITTSSPAIQNTDTVVSTVKVAKAEVPTQQKVEEKEVPAAPVSPSSYRSKLQKISELKGSEAYYITYVDVYENDSDTIQLLIPNSKVAPEKTDNDAPKFLNIETKQQPESPKATAQPTESKQPETNKASEITTKPVTQCTTLATDDDFFKLRKKMAAATDNDAMVQEAKKVFKSRCFTTLQVKNLSYLFLTDQSRYQFFDAAYPFVSDPNSFSSLSKELSDTYYINRFNAMLLN